MLLTGNYVRTLDEKQRMAIPRRLRDAMGFPNNTVVFLAPGTDGSLTLYTEEAFSRLADQLDQVSPTRSDIRAFSRMFYAQAQQVEMDRQGRLRVPPDLCSLASLTKEIILLGVRDHVEIWDRASWERYLEEKQQNYDEIAETSFSVGTSQSQSAMRSEKADGSVRPVQPR